MSQYKDSRPLNVDFDYDSLDILCPTTITGASLVVGPPTITVFQSPVTFNDSVTMSDPFTQNTWPRMQRISFAAMPALVANTVTPVAFSTPVVNPDTFALAPPVPAANYFTVGAGAITFLQPGYYLVKLTLGLAVPMSGNQNYRINMLSGPTPPPALPIIGTQGVATLGGGNPPTSLLLYTDHRYISSAGDQIAFTVFATEINTVTPVLTITKLG